MKPLKALALAAMLALTAGAPQAQPVPSGNGASAGKALVAYYSRLGGNTRIVAETIASKVQGTLLRLEPVEPYPEDYKVLTSGIAQAQLENDVRPELKDYGDIKDYEVIFVGTPVWGGRMTPVVKSFLARHDFAGKRVIPFITHGGGGSYNIPSDMRSLCPGAEFIEPEFAVNGRDSAHAGDDIAAWLSRIGY